MPTSSVPSVKAKILALLTAKTGSGEGLEGCQVTWADPGAKNMTREDVFMGDPFVDEKAAAMAANHPRDEHYALPVIVHVRQEGDDAEATERRMWSVVQVVENAIHPNTAFADVAGVLTWQVEQKIPDTFPHDAARVALCVVPIRFRCRIT